MSQRMLPYVNLKLLHEQLAEEIDAAVRRVLASGWYILGPEVEEFERSFAAYHGVSDAVSVANGTDAIELALRAGGIEPGDEVITVAHTAVATVNAVEQTGATPVLVDIDPKTYTMDVEAAAAAITPRTRALLPVHLYGHPANISEIQSLAHRHDLLLVEDCAQAHGARWQGQLVGTFGQLGTFSFYPTKNMGAYGDGGAIITNDSQLAERLRRLRNYGQTTRYTHVERGINSRMDEVQAAILGVKLRHLDEHNQRRREIAAFYQRSLQGALLPQEHPDAYHVYHLYVIRHPQRDRLMAGLREQGIGSLIHYPIPVHLQQSHLDLGYRPGSLPVTEMAAGEILSLPLYVGLTEDDMGRVAAAFHMSLQEITHA